MESVGTADTKNMLNMHNVEKPRSSRNGIFCKRLREMTAFFRIFGKKKFINLDDYAGSKFQFLIFKDEEYFVPILTCRNF